MTTSNGAARVSKAAATSQRDRPPPRIEVAAAGIPEQMRDLRQWLVWSWEWSERKGKYDKPPRTTQGNLASSTNSATWTTFAEALAYHRSRPTAGIGFVFVSGGGLVGIDLDDCRDPATGELDPWAAEAVRDLDSYTEVSPSGTGVKIVVAGSVPPGRCRKGAVEMYDHGRYFTVTGRRVEGTPATIEPRQEAIEQLHARYVAAAKPDRQRKRQTADGNATSHQGNGQTTDSTATNRDDQKLLDKAFAAKGGDQLRALYDGDTSAHGGDSSAADMALCDRLAFWFGPEPRRIDAMFRTSKLMREKWDERHYGDGRTYGEATIQKSLAGRTEFYKSVFTNFYEVDSPDGKSTAKAGYSAVRLAEQLCNATGGWPRRAGGQLFVVGRESKPLLLESPDSLFAWIARQLATGDANPVRWSGGQGMVTQAQFFAHLHQTAENYLAVEPFPHCPAMPQHYYMHPKPRCGKGKALAELLERFQGATDADSDLILAALLTLFWGGAPGQRPAFLIDADETDQIDGRGAGKTKLAQAMAHLVGGHIDARPGQDIEKLQTRLLSPAAIDRRVVLLDNVKTLRFSWSDLESLITTDTISGHRMYAGEGTRPNTLIWFITLNKASLSKDLAQRCVIIKVKRPARDPSWEAKTWEFIDAHRWEIIGDILNILESPGAALKRFSRWSAWEQAVLSHVPEPSDAQKVIEERQGDVDGDQADADLVRGGFVEELRHRGHDPEKEAIWIPALVAAQIVNQTTGERFKTNQASAHLRTLTISELKKSDIQGTRGWAWRGKNSLASASLDNLKPAPWENRENR